MNVFISHDNGVFGLAPPKSPARRATPCFTDYVEKANKIDSKRPFCNRNEDDSFDNLEKLLLVEEAFFETSDGLRIWRRTLNTLAINSGERKKHLQWLFRKGLSSEAGTGFFYSFCKKEWLKQEDYRHCAVCSKCYSVHTSWHCGMQAMSPRRT